MNGNRKDRQRNSQLENALDQGYEEPTDEDNKSDGSSGSECPANGMGNVKVGGRRGGGRVSSTTTRDDKRRT